MAIQGHIKTAKNRHSDSPVA